MTVGLALDFKTERNASPEQSKTTFLFKVIR